MEERLVVELRDDHGSDAETDGDADREGHQEVPAGGALMGHVFRCLIEKNHRADLGTPGLTLR
ncbi:hypothetical protein GCM10010289_04140 [Streptomyces violascens]|uniref:Uncharacterized protein n=1 Tax=Streptomyces violascens TaxID=67381 RepID=A0ABQ3QFR1_9ACTN|nr:hypothetical protein GCM10010289_04140 [Streptomyces violascens]GHI36080.1 hypothetical protein Sviol_04880 [Streptomyces violascens]